MSLKIKISIKQKMVSAGGKVSLFSLLLLVISFFLKYPKKIDYSIAYIKNITPVEFYLLISIGLCAVFAVVLMHKANITNNCSLQKEKHLNIFIFSIFMVLIIPIASVIVLSKSVQFPEKRFAPLNIAILANKKSKESLSKIHSNISVVARKVHEYSNVYLKTNVVTEQDIAREITIAKQQGADIVIIDNEFFADLLLKGGIDLESGSYGTVFFTLKPVAEASLKKNNNLISLAPPALDYLSYIATRLKEKKSEKVMLIVDDGALSNSLSTMLSSEAPSLRRVEFIKVNAANVNQESINDVDFVVNLSKLALEKRYVAANIDVIDFYSLSPSNSSVSPFFDREKILQSVSSLPLLTYDYPAEYVAALPVLIEAILDPDVGLGGVFMDAFLSRLGKHYISVDRLGHVDAFYSNIINERKAL